MVVSSVQPATSNQYIDERIPADDNISLLLVGVIHNLQSGVVLGGTSHYEQINGRRLLKCIPV